MNVCFENRKLFVCFFFPIGFLCVTQYKNEKLEISCFKIECVF